jgi:hypothetical protein
MLSTTGAEQLAIPDRAFVPVMLTVTFVLFQPAAFDCGEAAALAVGGIFSILTGGEVKIAVFPATSVTITLPLTDGPSLVSNNGLGMEVEATPDKLSAVVKPKLTFVFCQPAALGGGAAVANVSVGGVLSILTLADLNVALFPATSVTVTVPVTDDPSLVKVRGLGTDVDATPDKASAAINGNATLVLFHPAAFGAGVAAPKVSVGGVLSMLIPETLAGRLTFPALSVQVPEAD